MCVYCGAKSGKGDEYLRAADRLGDELLRRETGLVFGGGRIGMMGRIADRVTAGGGEAIGVIPKSLLDLEVAHDGLSELKVVADMHERKALMAELSDGFIAMPGGLGTLEELFEALAWAQLKFHNKPCAVYNACNYYDGLDKFLEHAVAEGFVKQRHRELMIIESDAAKLLQRMTDFIAR